MGTELHRRIMIILVSLTVLQVTFCEARGSHVVEYEDYDLLVCDAVLFDS
jgi:hypothetical protein